MIYKFKFEIWNDENKKVLKARSEESGDFWKAFIPFLQYMFEFSHAQMIDVRDDIMQLTQLRFALRSFIDELTLSIRKVNGLKGKNQ